MAWKPALLLPFALLCAAPSPARIQEVRTPPPGEGVLCTLAIYVGLEEIGRQCFPGEDAAFRTELRTNIETIERYVRANSSITDEQLRRFEAQMADAQDPGICKGDGVEMYRHVRTVDLEKQRAAVAEQTARPGTPTLEPCL